ncbi:MAG: 4Fe-4S dicluster domain-containing protein [bacterium]
MMSQDAYFQLGERLNEYQVKMMLVEPYLKILREIYTDEEAQLGAEFPLGAHTAPELGQKLGRPEKPLAELLERMADKGTIFVTKSDDGVSRYALTPFVPGVVEFQLMRGTDTPKDRKFAKMLEEFMEGEMADLARAAFKDPEVAKQMIPVPPARTVTVQKELPPNTQVYSFEKLSQLVEQENFFGAAKCYCRHHAYLVGKPCKVPGVPEYSCLMFGKTAEYVTERGFGKRITKEEAYRILEATEKAGLVHNTSNLLDSTVFVCNCCGCCCGFLKSMQLMGTNAMLSFSNFRVQADTAECVGCGDCVERCQVGALSLAEDVISVAESKCLGCGNCVSACPTECLTMVRRSEWIPPEAGDSLGGLGM